jgi:hypothetical protein
MELEFVYLPKAEGVLSDEEWGIVEQTLLDDPQAGDLVAHTGGVRKLRVAFKGRGKSGSARTIYLHVDEQERVYFLLVYPKNVKADLSGADKKVLRAQVKELKS